MSLARNRPRPRARMLSRGADSPFHQEYNNLFGKTLECDQGCPGCECLPSKFNNHLFQPSHDSKHEI